MTTERAWHFVGATLCDGRPVPPDDEWLVHEGPIKMCYTGLHASTCILDALNYARHGTICRVEVAEIAERDTDKLVARRRRILWRVDDTDAILRAFARRAALSVAHLWNMPVVVRQYLETGDENLRAAANDAARAANAAANAASAATRESACAASAAAWAAWADSRGAARSAECAARASLNADLHSAIATAAGHPEDKP